MRENRRMFLQHSCKGLRIGIRFLDREWIDVDGFAMHSLIELVLRIKRAI